MEELKARIEIVTPLFLGGVEPRGDPELRAPSFRGVLRFWLRALLGGVLGGDSKKVFEKESEVFGSTDRVSSITVRVNNQGVHTKISLNPLLHKESKFSFKGFGPSQTFELILSGRNRETLEEASKALQLLCWLGGLGRRSRRGFGSLQIIGGDLPGLQSKTVEEFCQSLETQLKVIMDHNGCLPLPSVPAFPVLHPEWAQVKVCEKEFDSWQEAIRSVMEKAHQFKNPALGWAEKAGRQSSPVHVHVARLVNNKYILILTTMLSSLNPALRERADRQRLVDFLAAFKNGKDKIIFGFEEVPKQWPTGRKR